MKRDLGVFKVLAAEISAKYNELNQTFFVLLRAPIKPVILQHLNNVVCFQKSGIDY